MTILLAGQILAAALGVSACCAISMRPSDNLASSQSVKAVVSSGHCHATDGEKKASAPVVKKTSAGHVFQAEISLAGGSHELCLCLAAGDAQEKSTFAPASSDRRDEQPTLIPAERQAQWLLDPSPPLPGLFSPSNIQRSPHTGFQLSLRI